MRKLYQTGIAFLLCGAGFAQTTSVPFTSSGTFVVPADVTEVTIEVVGAGGDGGGNGGGGGGGGGYASGTYTVTPGSTLTVTVGTHGMGTIGGGTSVDMLIAASGGSNGSSGGASPGGAGGSGVNGSVNRTGGTGGNGTWTYFGGGGGGAAGSVSNGTVGGNTPGWTGSNCLQPGGAAGNGGGAPGGNGGKGSGFIDNSCNANDPATPGLNYGGGGGGGNGNGGPSSPGANGYCVITYTSCSVDITTSVLDYTITANATGATYQWLDCDTDTQIPGATNASYTATAPGNYAVIVTDGCADTSDCVAITCSLDLTTTLVDFTISSNETNPVSFQWINCATNLPISGETNSSYTATADGDYAVIVTDGPCSDTSACVNIFGLGITNSQPGNITVYPNPFTNKIVIEHETGAEYFELINTQGQLVWNGKNIESADFSTLPQGTYILKIRQDDQVQLISLIKK